MRRLAGYVLMFTGLGWVVLCLFCSGRFPATPFWVFVCAAVVGAVPLMVVGNRLGHPRSAGATPEQHRAEYRRDMFRFAVALGWLGAWGALAALPVFVRGLGLFPWNPNAAVVWYVGVLLVAALGGRVLYPGLERRALAWWSGDVPGPGAARTPAAPPCPVPEPATGRVLPRTPRSDVE